MDEQFYGEAKTKMYELKITIDGSKLGFGGDFFTAIEHENWLRDHRNQNSTLQPTPQEQTEDSLQIQAFNIDLKTKVLILQSNFPCKVMWTLSDKPLLVPYSLIFTQEGVSTNLLASFCPVHQHSPSNLIVISQLQFDIKSLAIYDSFWPIYLEFAILPGAIVSEHKVDHSKFLTFRAKIMPMQLYLEGWLGIVEKTIKVGVVFSSLPSSSRFLLSSTYGS